jgi:pimeloyl-ACP methyl ester carboxylesterase
MRNRLRLAFLWWVALSIFGCAAREGASPPDRLRVGRLVFAPCLLEDGVEAQCTTLAVAENREHPEARTIDLAIALFPATREAAADPVFLLAGGPGLAARDTFARVKDALAEVNKNHHLVLVDQRGTGASNRLDCSSDAGTSAEGEVSALLAERCAVQLASRADPRWYSTTEAIADLDEVRAALQAERVNLYGHSYGTRVAQQYAKRYPAHTRTVTLDGVVPNSMVLGQDFAKNLSGALDLYFAQWSRHTTRAVLDRVLARLQADQPRVNYRDPVTGEARVEVLTRKEVVQLVRLYAYQPRLAGLLPVLLREADQGRYEPLMALARLGQGSGPRRDSSGMTWSVLCAEDADELVVEGASDEVAQTKSACAAWPHRARPVDFRAPLEGAVPVLLLSGELDPVTPPSQATLVASHLSNARQLTLKGQGHGVVWAGCVPRLFARFVETARPADLDTTCLDKLAPALAFTSFSGWDP